MIRPLLIAVALLLLISCSSRSPLPYTPEQQPPGARLSAGYQVIGERLKIEIDTDGRPLEEAQILKADGTALPPQAIEQTMAAPGPGAPVGIGVGVGGGSWSGGRSGGVGVGSGVSVGIPVGTVGGGAPAAGTALAYFPLDQAGPAPWRLRVKVAGTNPAVIVVGGPAGDAPR